MVLVCEVWASRSTVQKEIPAPRFSKGWGHSVKVEHQRPLCRSLPQEISAPIFWISMTGATGGFGPTNIVDGSRTRHCSLSGLMPRGHRTSPAPRARYCRIGLPGETYGCRDLPAFPSFFFFFRGESSSKHLYTMWEPGTTLVSLCWPYHCPVRVVTQPPSRRGGRGLMIINSKGRGVEWTAPGALARALWGSLV